jgi:hypothetical protein
VEVDVGDVIPLFAVAASIILTRLMLGRGLLAFRFSSAAGSRAHATRLWPPVPRAFIDAVVDLGLLALAIAHFAFLAILFVSAVGALP